MNTVSIEKKKNCSDCNTSFTCCSGGCWCSDLPHVMSYSQEKDCLCPDCLTKAIHKKQEDTA